MTEERSAEERIAAAAVTVIGTKGYQEATIDEIVEEAGATRAEFDALYPSKEDCYIAAYRRERQLFMERLARTVASAESWVDGMRLAAFETHAYFVEDDARGPFSAIEPLNAGDRIAALMDETLDLLVELVHAGRHELEDPDSVPRSAAESVVGSSWSALVKYLRENAPLPPAEEVAPLLVYFAIIPYKGAEVARQEFERMSSHEFSDS